MTHEHYHTLSHKYIHNIYIYTLSFSHTRTHLFVSPSPLAPSPPPLLTLLYLITRMYSAPFPPVACDPACGVHGCNLETPSTCCPASCAGGCTGTGNTCLACAAGFYHVSDGIGCVASCPAGERHAGLQNVAVPECDNRLNTDTMRFEPYYCTATCTGITGALGDDCVFPCPAALAPVDGVCPPVPAGNTDVGT